jgi:excisionase family DNA binding protein
VKQGVRTIAENAQAGFKQRFDVSRSAYAIIEVAIRGDKEIPEERKNPLLKAIRSLMFKGELKPRMGTREEAMKILGVSRPTIGRWIKKGKITPIYLSPGKVRFDLNEIEWYAEHGSHSDP